MKRIILAAAVGGILSVLVVALVAANGAPSPDPPEAITVTTDGGADINSGDSDGSALSESGIDLRSGDVKTSPASIGGGLSNY